MKTFTNEDETATQKEKFKLEPSKTTLDFITKFARVYQVAKTECIKTEVLILN